MGMPANFWTTDWADVEVVPDFTGATITNFVAAGFTNIRIQKPVNVCASAYQSGDDGSVAPYEAGNLSPKSSGLFTATRTSVAPNVTGVTFTKCAPSGGWLPHTPATPLILNPAESWVPPFVGMKIVFGGFSDDGSAVPLVGLESNIYLTMTAGVATYNLDHYQPLTFAGLVAEVIGAILMWAGADPDTDIDQDSFDEAYDEQLAWGADITERPFVWARAEIGEPVSELLKRVVRHTADFLTVNMAGKIALVPRDAGLAGPTELTQADVIGKSSVSFPVELVSNRAVTVHGKWSAYRVGKRTTWDPNYDNDPDDVRFTLIEDTDSIAVYGERSAGEGKREIRIPAESRPPFTWTTGRPSVAGVLEFPMFYYEEQKDKALERFDTNESQLKTVVKLKQDFLGLDYDIGYRVLDVKLLTESTTIDAMRCTKKSLDFNNLTVVSTLIEEFE